MNKIFIKMNEIYNCMSRSEQKIANWVLKNQQETIVLSVSELAEKCKCGEATIVRFCKLIGLNGFKELKISITQELNSSRILFPNITSNDNCFNIFTKQTVEILKSLEYTQKVLSEHELEQAAQVIVKANRIAIFGLGATASLAMYAQDKFMRAGFNSTAYLDNHMQLIAACGLRKGDVALAISCSDLSGDIADALQCSRKCGADTICIINNAVSPIIMESQIVLCTAVEEKENSLDAAHIIQMAVINLIYTYCKFIKTKDAIKAYRVTEEASNY